MFRYFYEYEKNKKKKNYIETIKNRFIERFKNVTFKFFSFIMIYTIHKNLVWIKNHSNYLQDNIFECFFKEYYILLFFFL